MQSNFLVVGFKALLMRENRKHAHIKEHRLREHKK